MIYLIVSFVALVNTSMVIAEGSVMSKAGSTASYDITKTPDNFGVTYEDLKTIMYHRHSSTVIGDNDIM